MGAYRKGWPLRLLCRYARGVLGTGIRRDRMRILLGLVVAAVAATFLVAGTAQASSPGKNGKIAWNDDSYCGGICTVNPDGSGQALLVANRQAFSPAWSPDGSKLAYTDTGEGSIHVVRADGTDDRLVVRSPDAVVEEPSWSPDGNRIGFLWLKPRFDSRSLTGFDNAIRTVNSEGGDERELLRSATDDYLSGPSFSPDGTKIAFTRRQGGNQDPIFHSVNRLYTMNVDGTDVRKLAEPGNNIDDEGTFTGPAWSPDGSRILFFRETYHDTCDPTVVYGGDLYTIRPDGSDLRRITTSRCVAVGSFDWSPDGSRIVFGPYALGADHTQLYTMRSDGTGAAALGVTSGTNSGLSWQPIPGPRRSDYKSANRFCKAEQAFWGAAFRQRYRSFGQCVSGSR